MLTYPSSPFRHLPFPQPLSDFLTAIATTRSCFASCAATSPAMVRGGEKLPIHDHLIDVDRWHISHVALCNSGQSQSALWTQHHVGADVQLHCCCCGGGGGGG